MKLNIGKDMVFITNKRNLLEVNTTFRLFCLRFLDVAMTIGRNDDDVRVEHSPLHERILFTSKDDVQYTTIKTFVSS